MRELVVMKRLDSITHYHYGDTCTFPLHGRLAPIVPLGDPLFQEPALARIGRVVVPDLPHHVTQRGNRRLDYGFKVTQAYFTN